MKRNHQTRRAFALSSIALTALAFSVLAGVSAEEKSDFGAGKVKSTNVPDFTQGEKIPEGAKHDWNLGATGLRGWIYCDKMVTSDARADRDHQGGGGFSR
ncbi:MAG: hypothetical protein EXS36_17730 [Pedosphaera sp.]|nr:hypothetical protein [Pedosphaera sp.]